MPYPQIMLLVTIMKTYSCISEYFHIIAHLWFPSMLICVLDSTETTKLADVSSRNAVPSSIMDHILILIPSVS